MANRYKNLIYSTAEYTHTYRDFKGVELNASSTVSSRSRLSYLQNMYKDYDGNGADVIESVPGFRCFAHYGETVNGLFYQRSPFGNEDHILVHVKNKLYRHPISDTLKENSSGVEIAELNDTKSFGFEYGRHFYIMDSEKILQISDDGSCKAIGAEGAEPYIPTVYVSGEEYEQRNLLTDKFKEEYYVSEPSVHAFYTKGLKYAITDPALRYCSVIGIDPTISGEVYIPASISISGVSYKVMSVGENAFLNNTAITAIFIPDGVTGIGKRSFCGCTSLITAVIPSSVLRIEEGAFSGCSLLSELYTGASLNYIGVEAFSGCIALHTVNYALGENDLKKISGYEAIKARSVVYNSIYEPLKISLPLHDKVENVSSVKIKDNECQWDCISENGHPTAITVTFASMADATDIKITVLGSLTPLEKDWCADMTSLTDMTPYQAIMRSKIAEVFDGRIFFSGNPDFPNTVFYTERPRQGEEGALYVGRYDYFNDGVGSYKVKSMLAVRDMLAVFKEGDDGSGSIFYHSKENTSVDAIDTVYPVAYVHSGICSSGMCLSFLDDPVFLTNEGLMALNNENINYQRNVVCRSHNVNFALLKEDLSKASLCEWLGYLVVGSQGKIFLADSRSLFRHPTGAYEYEWFMLTDIGAYNEDHEVYRYSEDPYMDAKAHPTRVGEAADYTTVVSAADATGTSYAYVTENGSKYRVVATAELGGGTFFPASLFISHGKRLFFATDDGHLCVFNNDMRGVAPDSVKSSADYNEAEYLSKMADKLHPHFYSFAGHAPSYIIRTALDDCGIPHLTKSTVKKSLVIKAKSNTPYAIHCDVKSDENDATYVDSLPASSMGFDSFSFTNTPWNTGRYGSVALSENEKRWIEKQITLSSQSFESPIAIYSISYRYTIKGKIKNNA